MLKTERLILVPFDMKHLQDFRALYRALCEDYPQCTCRTEKYVSHPYLSGKSVFYEQWLFVPRHFSEK